MITFEFILRGLIERREGVALTAHIHICGKRSK
jgi:hypothetical protein